MPIDINSPVCLLCQSGYHRNCNEPTTCACLDCKPIVCIHCGGGADECLCFCRRCESAIALGADCPTCHPACGRCDRDMSRLIEDIDLGTLFDDTNEPDGAVCSVCQYALEAA